jgi:hypothetical protein
VQRIERKQAERTSKLQLPPAGNEFCVIAAYNYSIGGAWGWDDRRCDEKHIFMCRLQGERRRRWACTCAPPCPG